MDTQTKGSVVWNQEPGFIPLSRITFYRGEKPAVTPLDGMRIAFLGSKAKEGKQREKMAVQVAKLDSDQFNGVSGHQFLCDLLADYQDSNLPRVQSGDCGIEVLEDTDKMIADYNDTSRDSSGRKVTKEKIAEYVLDSSIAAVITTRALLKNAQMSEETLGKVLAGYAEMFGRMTKFGLSAIYTPPQATLIRQLLDTSEDDGSEMREWIKAKFAKIEDSMKADDKLLEAI